VAREVIEKVTDDLDGIAAAETVSFALDGTTYEIDLSKKYAAGFRKSLERYVHAARRHSPTGRPVRAARRASVSGNRRRACSLG
jgi:nucleoid-associated protein Lsr2